MRKCCNYKVVGEGEFKVTPSVTDLGLDNKAENVIVTYSDGHTESLELPEYEGGAVDADEIINKTFTIEEGMSRLKPEHTLSVTIQGKKYLLPVIGEEQEPRFYNELSDEMLQVLADYSGGSFEEAKEEALYSLGSYPLDESVRIILEIEGFLKPTGTKQPNELEVKPRRWEDINDPDIGPYKPFNREDYQDVVARYKAAQDVKGISDPEERAKAVEEKTKEYLKDMQGDYPDINAAPVSEEDVQILTKLRYLDPDTKYADPDPDWYNPRLTFGDLSDEDKEAAYDYMKSIQGRYASFEISDDDYVIKKIQKAIHESDDDDDDDEETPEKEDSDLPPGGKLPKTLGDLTDEQIEWMADNAVAQLPDEIYESVENWDSNLDEIQSATGLRYSGGRVPYNFGFANHYIYREADNPKDRRQAHRDALIDGYANWRADIEDTTIVRVLPRLAPLIED